MKNAACFVNLSNHPVKTWDETQILAAEEMGKIIDLPFPDIMPEMDVNEIDILACQYVERVLALVKNERLSVHVMGEMCFTHRFVNLMTQRGIPCYASTSRRVVTEKGGGVKEAVFQFVRFRKYM